MLKFCSAIHVYDIFYMSLVKCMLGYVSTEPYNGLAAYSGVGRAVGGGGRGW